MTLPPINHNFRSNPSQSSTPKKNPFASGPKSVLPKTPIPSPPGLSNLPGISFEGIKKISSNSSLNSSYDGATSNESREVTPPISDVFQESVSRSPITPKERFLATPTPAWGRTVCDLALPGNLLEYSGGKTLRSKTVSEMAGYQHLRNSPISMNTSPILERSGGPLVTEITVDMSKCFHVGPILGGGATASVATGKMTKSGTETQDVAIKKVKVDAFDTEGLERCIRERELLEHLSYIPGVVKCHDFFSFVGEGGPQIAYALSLEGPSLQSLIYPVKTTPDSIELRTPDDPIFPLCEAPTVHIRETYPRFIDSLLKTAVAIFDAGVIHGDYKPDNILVGKKDGMAKICDFGFSLYANEMGLAPRPAQYTPDYAAPEISNGKGPSSQKSEVFSLGCVLYEMYTGTKFTTGNEVVKRIIALTKGNPDPKIPKFETLRQVPGVSSHVVSLIKDMLELNPDDRPTLKEASDRFNDPSLMPPSDRVTAQPTMEILRRLYMGPQNLNPGYNPLERERVSGQLQASFEESGRQDEKTPKRRLRDEMSTLAKQTPGFMAGRKIGVNRRNESIIAFGTSEMMLSKDAAGKGGFGKVKLSQKKVNGQTLDVAIKRTLAKGNPLKAIREILREHRIQSQFSGCGSILQSYGVGYYESNKAIHMGSAVDKYEIPKFGEGQTTLHTFSELELALGHFKVPKDGIPVEIAIDHFIKLASAVDLMHQHQVVHRDLKYANILLGTDGELKISDFGSAVEKIPPDMLVRKSVAGTPALLPPETLGLTDGKMKGIECVCHESDWYSLGYVFSAMLTGQSHLKNESVYQSDHPKRVDWPKLESYLTTNVFRRNIETDMTEKRLPRLIIDLLLQMTKFDPKDRPSGTKIIAQLTDIKASLVTLADGPDEESTSY